MMTMTKDEKLVAGELMTYLLFAMELIRDYPVFGSAGQYMAQNKIAAMMRTLNFDDVILDEFYAKDISSLDDYVRVEEFGEAFSDYSKLSRLNIMGIIDSGRPGPELILNGHIDVDQVYDEHQWSRKNSWREPYIIDSRLYGRGATDMIMGLVSHIRIGAWLAGHKDQWRGKVIIISVVDEEIGGNGTLRSLQYLSERNMITDNVECIISEPSNGIVGSRSTGFLHFATEAFSRPVHMGMATEGNNALWSLMAFLSEVKIFCAQHPDLRFNVGKVAGGKDAAVPIGHCNAEGTIFYPAGFDLQSIKQSLYHLAEKQGIQLSFTGFCFPGADFEKSKIIPILNQHNGTVFQKDNFFPSPCDARLFAKYNIPTAIFGPGFLQDAHSTNESIDLRQWQDIHTVTLLSCVDYLNED